MLLVFPIIITLGWKGLHRDKHSNLLWKSIIYGCKKFYRIGPGLRGPYIGFVPYCVGTTFSWLMSFFTFVWSNTTVEEFYKFEEDSNSNAYYYLNNFDSLPIAGVTLFELTGKKLKTIITFRLVQFRQGACTACWLNDDFKRCLHWCSFCKKRSRQRQWQHLPWQPWLTQPWTNFS